MPDREKKEDTISEFISLARSKVDVHVQDQLPKAVEAKAKHGTGDLVPTQVEWLWCFCYVEGVGGGTLSSICQMDV